MKPSVGRIVHYVPREGMGDPVPAIITKVHSELCVNLTIFYDSLLPSIETSVMLKHDETDFNAWMWPPRVEE